MLSRPHPVFGDWCYCQPGDSQRLLDRQLSYRDAALKADPEFSGMPPEFEQWCKTSWLPANLGRDFYREPGPLLTPEAVKPPNISKATVQRCISKLSPYWTDEQLDQVVEMFQAHGLL